MNIFRNETGKKGICSIGILIMENVLNEPSKDKLLSVRQEMEGMLRAKYENLTRGDLKALHPMDTYLSYYKKYGYTYHVLPQLESILKGKAIPGGFPLVEAMFMAEVKNMLLTAGHDLDKLIEPLCLRIATGNERFITMSGKEVTTISGDFMIMDRENIISSILRGPDHRTAITENTERVIFTVYAPLGVETQLVREHLEDIETYVRLCNKKAITTLKIIEN